MKAAFFNNSPEKVNLVFGSGRKEIIARETELYPHVITAANFAEHAEALRDVEVGFSTWGMSAELAEKLLELPSLKAFFYGAGTVQGFARPLLERGIVVMSAWGANAVPVAQFTVAQILLALKGYFHNVVKRHSPESRGKWLNHKAPGIFDETVALLGCGMIGAMVAEALKGYPLRVLTFDKYLDDARAEALGVEKSSLDSCFSEALVVSNHLPNLPATVGMLRGLHFNSMREGSTFINTGRGATVNEGEMIASLQVRPDIHALLDVTFPEPPAADSPLYTLDNVWLSSHIAGSLGNEVIRMGDYCIEEFRAYREGKPLRYAVSMDMLDRMA